ncbi:Septation ring formation regulator EzrA [Alkalibacterium sp. AK22]|uniref:septation ring formation regulator EzrA n=1 Tax=Alkalibacterium sp. AK22 TaxID=1229520 RepID=UPI00044D84DA|nr:septation ring formation regulator EzrA [Alkalibacterium sp. AK22]EXJ22832.1 Septation ring formation regulator EzrA [Alkalibacterium sp. AK22]
MTIEIVVAVSIIILAVMLYMSTYYLKKKNYTNIDQLDLEKKQAQSSLPAGKAEKLSTMALTGQTKAAADTAVEKVADIENSRLPEVEALLFEAEQATDRFRFKQASEYQEKSGAALKDIQTDADHLNSLIDELLQREEANLKKVESIKKRYHKIRKELLTNSFTFGDSTNSLEEKLGEVEAEFTLFSDLTASGDHEEARKIVSRLDSKISEMEKLMKRIPELIKAIEFEYLKQKEEIVEGYASLLDQGYLFPETAEVDECLSDLDRAINELKSSVSDLKISAVDQQVETVENRIDQIYDLMEAEIEAKPEVTKLIKQLKKIVLYVQDQKREISFEVDRINQSYTLYKDEEATMDKLKADFAAQTEQIGRVESRLADEALPYSAARDTLASCFNELENLSSKLAQLSADLYAYRQTEMEIKKDIDEMELALREMKRYIEHKNLPGLPKDYLDLFFYTTDHLEDLSRELARPRLDLEAVVRLHRLCEDDIESLAVQTDTLVDEALLTELVSQRLYRYREEHPEVIETIKYSESLFLNEFDYHTALKMVREKLETIEAGAFDEVSKAYTENKSYS